MQGRNMQGRNTVIDLKNLLTRENVKQSTIDKVLLWYTNAIRDEQFQKQHLLTTEENYTLYVQQIIDMLRNQQYTDKTAQAYIKFVFEKIYRGDLNK